MMVELARASNGGQKVSLGRVAKATNISKRYLEQLAIALRNASLITGVSGKGGGYLLARPADQIRVGQIVEAAIGPINIVACVLHPEQCIQVDYCECRWIYQRINTRITEVLNDFSLADLVAKNVPEQDIVPLRAIGSSCPARKG
jgi:Rrf2 family protein